MKVFKVVVHRSTDARFPRGMLLANGFHTLKQADDWHDEFMDRMGEPDINVTIREDSFQGEPTEESVVCSHCGSGLPHFGLRN